MCINEHECFSRTPIKLIIAIYLLFGSLINDVFLMSVINDIKMIMIYRGINLFIVLTVVFMLLVSHNLNRKRERDVK